MNSVHLQLADMRPSRLQDSQLAHVHGLSRSDVGGALDQKRAVGGLGNVQFGRSFTLPGRPFPMQTYCRSYRNTQFVSSSSRRQQESNG